MTQEKDTNSFKKLLDRLQEDSWQLELLISAFAIFGLFYALEPITDQLQAAQIDNNQVFLIFFIVVHFSLKILIFNLILHVLLRGLWIGSLGLRYVFGDIDYNKLNYSPKFTNHLKKKVGSFDDYIHKLENFCSVIFAFSFLLIFYISAFFIVNAILIIFQSPIANWMVPIVRVLFVIFALGVVLTFIDFMTNGLLKKNKWVAKFYFPFYRLFSIITLSFLYRPLVYNLLDNKYGRRISLGLIPFYLLIYVGFNFQYQKSNFITIASTQVSNSYLSNGANYEDVIETSEKSFIREFAIQSKVISDPYIKVNIPLSTKIEDGLMAYNPKLKPEIDQRGLHFQSEVHFFKKELDDNKISLEYLNTFQQKYKIKIDSKTYKSEFIIANNKGELGFESYIGIQDLPEGKHVIELQSLKRKGTDSLSSIHKVPFWYYQN